MIEIELWQFILVCAFGWMCGYYYGMTRSTHFWSQRIDQMIKILEEKDD